MSSLRNLQPIHQVIRRNSLMLLFLAIVGSVCEAKGPKALEDGALPPDSRLQPLKDLNGYFPFEPHRTPASWSLRKKQLQRQLLVALGLWPVPERTPLNPIVHGKMDLGDYTIEKVAIETRPGYYLTGNLYRPKNLQARAPGVLSPHGHWASGRFYDNGEANTAKEIESGAEKFADGGRSPLQSRMVHLARMGCVVFHYDMIGYADCTQISYQLAHRFSKQRPEMNTRENWGFFSPRAESHLQSIMGLQTWNNMRALDFVLSLPDVDGSRIGVTGASGGGTQTFMMGALDPRPRAFFPAVMVSTAMQGGCTCENAALLRVGTGNIEFAALAAPRAYGMTGANDWTVDMSTKGYPELKKHFAMLGAEDHVHLTALNQFGHNYNAPSRRAMYTWFNRHLRLGRPEAIEERDYKRHTAEELTVWDEAHPRPAGGGDFERRLLREWKEDSDRQIAQDPDIARVGIEAVIGRRLSEVGEVEFVWSPSEAEGKKDRGAHLEMTGLIQNRSHDEALPVVFLHPKENWNGDVVLWVHGEGKAGLFSEDGSPTDPVKELLAAGISVAGIDLLFQGEFQPDGKPLTSTRRVKNTREAACYTFGYNHSVFVQRAHDVLSAISLIKNHDYQPKRVIVAGSGGAGPIVAAAGTQATGAVDGFAIDTGGFRFIDVEELHSPNFCPGGAKYGDLPGMLLRLTPTPMLLADPAVDELKLAYETVHRKGNLKSAEPGDSFPGSLVRWVVGN